MNGGGGFGAVSIGISEPLAWLILVVILALVALGGWKLVKLVWAAFSG